METIDYSGYPSMSDYPLKTKPINGKTMKSKVTKVTKMDKQDSYGNTSFVIEFENGDKGFYTSKSADQTKFIVGKEADYNIEKKTGSTGKEYFKITVPQDQQGGFNKGGKPQVDPRIQMISFSASYAKDLIVGGKVTINDFESTFDRIYNKMTSKI